MQSLNNSDPRWARQGYQIFPADGVHSPRADRHFLLRSGTISFRENPIHLRDQRLIPCARGVRCDSLNGACKLETRKSDSLARSADRRLQACAHPERSGTRLHGYTGNPASDAPRRIRPCRSRHHGAGGPATGSREAGAQYVTVATAHTLARSQPAPCNRHISTAERA